MPEQLRPAIPCTHPGPGYLYDANGPGQWCIDCKQPLNDVESSGWGLPAIVLALALISMMTWAVFAILGSNGLGPTAETAPGSPADSSCEARTPEPTPWPTGRR